MQVNSGVRDWLKKVNKVNTTKQQIIRYLGQGPRRSFKKPHKEPFTYVLTSIRKERSADISGDPNPAPLMVRIGASKPGLAR